MTSEKKKKLEELAVLSDIPLSDYIRLVINKLISERIVLKLDIPNLNRRLISKNN